MTYNHALDYKGYEENMQLNPSGSYYPPACMMKEFRDFLIVLENNKNDYISGKTCFQQEVQPKY